VLDPTRIDHLVLVVTKGHGHTSSVLRYLTSKGLNPATLKPDALLAAMDDAIWSHHTSPDRRQAIMAAQQAALPPGFRDLAPEQKQAVDAALADFDLRPRLPGVTCPTLVISGRDDGLNPPEMGREVADLIPGAKFIMFENAGHMLTSEEPERLQREVLAFLAG
jgi:pimeloyl-ACP methyl ester carboxylesterase